VRPGGLDDVIPKGGYNGRENSLRFNTRGSTKRVQANPLNPKP